MSKHVTVRLLISISIPIGLVIVSIVVALLFGELLVRYIVNPGDFLIATTVKDPMLGHRIKPNTTGHDALGFRNAEVPERANIVAIGDSMTYGVSAPRDGSWPHQLGGLLSESVYNMSLGGYGPLQYLYLAEHEAKKFQPRHLIVGFYFGNDLVDSYRLARNTPYWNSWRDGALAKSDKSEEWLSADTEPKKRFADLRNWLSKHSVLYSMLRLTLFPWLATWEQDRIASQATPDQQVIWIDPSNKSIRTIFKPQIRLAALDTRDPMIQEGLRITKRAFAALQKEAETQGRNLLIVLIPTKERVYSRYIKDTGGHVPNTYISLCDAEDQIKQELVLFFAAEKIAHIDVVGAMEKQTYQHIQIYPQDSDGHPLATGYGVIARTVHDAIRHQQHEK